MATILNQHYNMIVFLYLVKNKLLRITALQFNLFQLNNMLGLVLLMEHIKNNHI